VAITAAALIAACAVRPTISPVARTGSIIFTPTA
jgi:hypothetical protein